MFHHVSPCFTMFHLYDRPHETRPLQESTDVASAYSAVFPGRIWSFRAWEYLTLWNFMHVLPCCNMLHSYRTRNQAYCHHFWEATEPAARKSSWSIFFHFLATSERSRSEPRLEVWRMSGRIALWHWNRQAPVTMSRIVLNCHELSRITHYSHSDCNRPRVRDLLCIPESSSRVSSAGLSISTLQIHTFVADRGTVGSATFLSFRYRLHYFSAWGFNGTLHIVARPSLLVGGSIDALLDDPLRSMSRRCHVQGGNETSWNI